MHVLPVFPLRPSYACLRGHAKPIFFNLLYILLTRTRIMSNLATDTTAPRACLISRLPEQFQPVFPALPAPQHLSGNREEEKEGSCLF
jgi:hypothetical protein